MLWIYVLALTAGIVLIVPAILRATDGNLVDPFHGFVGFAGTVFGSVALVLRQVELSTLSLIVASIALGAAAGAVHPEILKALARRNVPG